MELQRQNEEAEKESFIIDYWLLRLQNLGNDLVTR